MCGHSGERFTQLLIAYLTCIGALLRYSSVFIPSNVPLYFVSLMMALLQPKHVGNYKILYER